MGEIIIKEVTSRRERRKFVDYPNQLYRNNPNYVPGFYGDDLDDWDEKKNPAFAHCEAKCFLAYEEGKIVGRIGAILNHKSNETWNTNRMRFSQVDFIDDSRVSDALFGAVERWAREKGCDQVHGPLGFCDLDREGMLVECFDRKSMFITYYNAPYYVEHLERLGYRKDTDWIEFFIHVPTPDSKEGAMISRLARRLEKQGKYHIAPLRRRSDYRPYVKEVFRLVNEAYAPLYGVVKLNEKQIERYASKFIPLVNPDYACFIVDENERMVAFGVTVPSLADAMIRCRGRLFPFGWIPVLRALSKNDTVDLLLIAVSPELKGSTLIAMIFDHFIQSTHKNGIRFAETGPQLETNVKIQSQWKFFEREQHKRRRCFVKDLGE
ncbi:MAG: hypothetical protein IJX72_02640 [Clostridia bacterium]|nr:hypothetical protein [Clostridia bacterium]